MAADLSAPPIPYRPWHGVPFQCEHEDWNRLICDWERCRGTATWLVSDGDRTLKVCDEDRIYYEPNLDTIA